MGEETQQGQAGQGEGGNADPTSGQPVPAQTGSGAAGAGDGQNAGGAPSPSTGQAAGGGAASGQPSSASTSSAPQPSAGQTPSQGAVPGAQPSGPASTATPDKPPAGFRFQLTDAQRNALLAGQPLVLSDEQYTGGVRDQMDVLRRRATSAERRLSEIAAAQEEADRKALEEQERYKELYEKERQRSSSIEAARKEDLLRHSFFLASTRAGIIDPEVALVVAKGLPAFADLQITDEGKVTGVEELVKSLVESKPYLVVQTPKGGGPPTSIGSASNPAPQTLPAPKTLAEAGDRLEAALRTGTVPS